MSYAYFKSQNKAKEIELHIPNEPSPFPFRTNNVVRKNEGTIAESSMEKVLCQLNHMLWWLYNNPELICINMYSGEYMTVNAYNYILEKVIRLSMSLGMSSYENVALSRVEQGVDKNIDIAKVNVFTSIIHNELINDDIFIQIVHEYCLKNSVFNLQPTEEIEHKITDPDAHILHCISVILKFYHMCHIRSSENVMYANMARTILIKVGSKIDELNTSVFPHMYSMNVQSFFDRYFQFIRLSTSLSLVRNNDNADMFNLLGKDGSGVIDSCFRTSLDSLRIFTMATVLDKKWSPKGMIPEHNSPFYNPEWEYNKHIYDGMSDKDPRAINLFPYEFKFICKNVVGYIQNTVKNTASRETGLQNPKFLINVISSKIEDDGVSKSDRFEIIQERKDHEAYERLIEVKKKIIAREEKLLSKETLYKYLETLGRNLLSRHELNEYMVSQYLEQQYDENVYSLLTTKEFLLLVFRVHQKLVGRYHDLAFAMIGNKIEGVNKVSITEQDIPNLLMFKVNPDKTSKVLCDIAKHKYNTTQGDTANVRVIKDELIQFLNDGGVI
ncbi:MAG: hypothetical protein ACRC92_26030 [Peptostreptococcaceae bacterium]